jgi:hypothetical protein
MKAMPLSLMIFFLLLVVSCSSPIDAPTALTPTPLKGNEGASGGDTFAGEFKETAKGIVGRMEARGIEELEGVFIKALDEAIETTRLETTDEKLFLTDKDGVLRRKDALNFPEEKRILISLIHWKNGMDLYEKRRLVLHEYLGILRIDDANFERTVKILSKLEFISTLSISSFSVDGPVAQTIIDRLRWSEDEILREAAKKFPRDSLEVTHYVITQFPGQEILHCIKNVFTDSFNGKTNSFFRCDFNFVSVSLEEELGTATIRVGGDSDPLWQKLKSENTGSVRFDYGPVLGVPLNHNYNHIILRLTHH